MFESKLYGEKPQIILLHEGLGSLSTLGNFPHELHVATALGVYVYSRKGYGGSPATKTPFPISYMHEEAVVLGEILNDIGFESGYLLGHSDGASIATIYAGTLQDPRLKGISLLAPHFFVEDISIKSINQAKIAYEAGDLKAKLARHHHNPDTAFYGWNGAWLNPSFRSWNIEAELKRVLCPIQIIQGEEDQYGTNAQIEIAQKWHDIDVTLLKNCGHNPMREAKEACITSLASHFARHGL